ncbi:MAG: hypothetical protein GYA87_08935 [Christensenellaceae bacterium]|nr:hypothetical protein [Christensenellaceae bacterium]
MNNEQKLKYFADYNNGTHTIGRIGVSLIIIMLIGAPFVMGTYLKAMPDMPAFWAGLAQILLIWVPSSMVEFLIYTPMLGAGGTYLAFTTGNLLNMKIPCVANARELSGAKVGTPENEIISTLSIATSALVTTVVIALGVLLLIPLQPVLKNPVLQPAFDNVVPALFGAMAYRYFRKNLNIAILPLVLMSALFIAIPSLISSVGFMIIPSGALSIAIAWYFYKKKNKEVN